VRGEQLRGRARSDHRCASRALTRHLPIASLNAGHARFQPVRQKGTAGLELLLLQVAYVSDHGLHLVRCQTLGHRSVFRVGGDDIGEVRI
jgi:hypothetical protein